MKKSHDNHEERECATIATPRTVQQVLFLIGFMKIQERGKRNDHRFIDLDQESETTTLSEELTTTHLSQMQAQITLQELKDRSRATLLNHSQ